MFHVQSSFEQSLRGGDENSPTGNKTLAALAKIHKHCTGKSHANGCIDNSPKQNALIKSDSNASIHSRKSFRSDCIIEIKEPHKQRNKNGVKLKDTFIKSFSNSTSSYEGHSDTDSESTTRTRTDPLKTPDPCERLFAQNTKASLAKTARMRYADDAVISTLQDEVDGDKSKQTLSRSALRTSFRERKTNVVTIEEVKSDGSANDEDLTNAVLFDEKRKIPVNVKQGTIRNNCNGKQLTNGKSNGVKPPWRGASRNVLAETSNFSRSPSLRGSIRKKTNNKKDGISWKRLYELSLWRKYGVSFAVVGADLERALLRPWSELSTQPEPPPDLLSVSNIDVNQLTP